MKVAIARAGEMDSLAEQCCGVYEKWESHENFINGATTRTLTVIEAEDLDLGSAGGGARGGAGGGARGGARSGAGGAEEYTQVERVIVARSPTTDVPTRPPRRPVMRMIDAMCVLLSRLSEERYFHIDFFRVMERALSDREVVVHFLSGVDHVRGGLLRLCQYYHTLRRRDVEHQRQQEEQKVTSTGGTTSGSRDTTPESTSFVRANLEVSPLQQCLSLLIVRIVKELDMDSASQLMVDGTTSTTTGATSATGATKTGGGGGGGLGGGGGDTGLYLGLDDPTGLTMSYLFGDVFLQTLIELEPMKASKLVRHYMQLSRTRSDEMMRKVLEMTLQKTSHVTQGSMPSYMKVLQSLLALEEHGYCDNLVETRMEIILVPLMLRVRRLIDRRMKTDDCFISLAIKIVLWCAIQRQHGRRILLSSIDGDYDNVPEWSSWAKLWKARKKIDDKAEAQRIKLEKRYQNY